MEPDSRVIAQVVSWACGFVGLLALGLAVPFLASVLPDATVELKGRRSWRPLAQIVASAFLLVVLGVWFVSRASAPGTPSATVWGALSLLCALVSTGVLLPLTVGRSLRRGRDRRARRADLDRPLAAIDPSNTARGPKPAPIEGELHWRRAEFLAAEWMQYLGATRVEVTPGRRDGGFDVSSSDAIAQVKCYQRDLIGVDLVRQLVGAASARRRRALFFSTTGFTSDAQEFARSTSTALFVMRPTIGGLVPIGPLASRIWNEGLREARSSDAIR